MPPSEPTTLKHVKWLYTLYARWNKKFWDGCLPKEVLIQIVAGDTGYSIDCRKEEGATTLFSDGTRAIVELGEVMLQYPPFAKLVFMHELIHVSGVHGHGKEFKTAVRRLAGKGALLELLK